jgi:hypothetical protein
MKKMYVKPELRRLTNTGELIERLKELPEATAVMRYQFIAVISSGKIVKRSRRPVNTTGKLIKLLRKFPQNTVIKEFTIELVDKQLYPIKIEQK